MGVNKREKVIKGLEYCAASCKGAWDENNGCPYMGDFIELGPNHNGRCVDLLCADAIALLKAQEPVKPIMHYVPDGKRLSAAWQCGNCLIDIGYGANYCYNCGRAVKWE